MPKVRNQNGARSRFAPARILRTVLRAYEVANDGYDPLHRLVAQRHTEAVIASLQRDFGSAEDVDWPADAIAQAVVFEIKANAPSAVYAAVAGQQGKVKPGRPVKDRSGGNPVWAVAMPSTGQDESADVPPDAVPAQVGDPVRPVKARRRASPGRRVLRSDWISLWRALASRVSVKPDMELIETRILSEPMETRRRTPQGWMEFWESLFLELASADPRVLPVYQRAVVMDAYASLTGHEWVCSPWLPELPPPEAGLNRAEPAPVRRRYASLWRQNFKAFMDSGRADPRLAQYDLMSVSEWLDPARDHLLTAQGWRRLMDSGCSHRLYALGWSDWPQAPAPHATEPPQWVWLRVALGMAVAEEDPVSVARELYEEISSLRLIPSESILRAAGYESPALLDDVSSSVDDSFEGIHEAIFGAAAATKWTGTASLDWSAVRGRGSPASRGRSSPGTVGFQRTLSSAMEAQGRLPDDRPVTVSLPAWHWDLEGWIAMPENGAERLQAVIDIPDPFFAALREGGDWVLIDPARTARNPHDPFTDEDYQDALLRAGRGEGGFRKVSASRIWGLLLSASERGNPFLSFSGVHASARSGSGATWLPGVDGVGSFPSAGGPVSWPAAAANLALMSGEDGVISRAVMDRAVRLGMRLLDNAIILDRSPPASTLYFRPVCLGAVGYFEAISVATSTAREDDEMVNRWVAQLGQSWAQSVASADEVLARERGHSPAYEEGFAPFNPVERMEGLAAARSGARPVSVDEDSDALVNMRLATRFTCRTIWAPFEGLSMIAGATAGGLGTLRLADAWVSGGETHDIPSPLWTHLAKMGEAGGLLPSTVAGGDSEGWGSGELVSVWQQRKHPKKWPDAVRQLVMPDASGWSVKIRHAALLAPWMDLGVSVTVDPSGIDRPQLSAVVQKAWWMGVSSLRFEPKGAQAPVRNAPTD